MKRPIKFARSTGDGGTKKKKGGSKASKVTKRKKSKPEYIMSHEVVELFCEKLNITQDPVRLDISLESGQPVVISMDYIPTHKDDDGERQPIGLVRAMSEESEVSIDQAIEEITEEDSE